jgi:hypothetical protein
LPGRGPRHDDDHDDDDDHHDHRSVDATSEQPADGDAAGQQPAGRDTAIDGHLVGGLVDARHVGIAELRIPGRRGHAWVHGIADGPDEQPCESPWSRLHGRRHQWDGSRGVGVDRNRGHLAPAFPQPPPGSEAELSRKVLEPGSEVFDAPTGVESISPIAQ